MDVKPARLPRRERREHFLDVAAELIVEQGLEAVTMERVAAQAGVSKGLGYAYFGNSSELLVALFDREMAELDRRVAEATAAAPGFEARIRAVLDTWFDTVAERGPLLGTLLQAKMSAGPLERRRRSRQRAVEQFFADMAAAELGLPPRTALAAAAILLSGSTGALELWITRRGSRRELTDTFVRLAMGGLRALADADSDADAHSDARSRPS